MLVTGALNIMLYLFYILFARFIISNLNSINKPTVHAHIHVQPSKQDIIVVNALLSTCQPKLATRYFAYINYDHTDSVLYDSF